MVDTYGFFLLMLLHNEVSNVCMRKVLINNVIIILFFVSLSNLGNANSTFLRVNC